MLTLQHTLVTLLGLRGNERELEEEVKFILLPDAIRKYSGPRQYSHFEKTYDGKEVSWLAYPINLKTLTAEEVSNVPKYIAKDIKPCVLGEETDIKAFEEHNTHLPLKYFYGIKKHLMQDYMFDEFVREKIDCSKMYEDKFYFNGKEYDGKGIRGVIADFENYGVYILAYILNKSYGITANQQWFDKHVKNVIEKEYPEDLSANTYKYMQIPKEIDEMITAGDWGHLEEGPLSLEEYITMYEKVIKEMPKIDMERKIKEDNSSKKSYESSNKVFSDDHDETEK